MSFNQTSETTIEVIRALADHLVSVYKERALDWTIETQDFDIGFFGVSIYAHDKDHWLQIAIGTGQIVVQPSRMYTPGSIYFDVYIPFPYKDVRLQWTDPDLVPKLEALLPDLKPLRRVSNRNGS